MKIIECPRDAMQGIKGFIPTELKAEYLNQLLKVGFDTLDFGSFVSPKAIPQLRDTTEVLSALDLTQSKTKLLAIVANVRGAEDACKHEPISFLGYPFSISETFQQRNTNRGIDQAWLDLQSIVQIARDHGKEVVAYISMGFGNPYGDSWNQDIVSTWAERMVEAGIKTISLADTVGNALPEDIHEVFTSLMGRFSQVEFGAHFHSTPLEWKEKIQAAFDAGCIRFDTAIKGYGGCPMAEDSLTGNIATENLLFFLDNLDIDTGLNRRALEEAMFTSSKVFEHA